MEEFLLVLEPETRHVHYLLSAFHLTEGNRQTFPLYLTFASQAALIFNRFSASLSLYHRYWYRNSHWWAAHAERFSWVLKILSDFFGTILLYLQLAWSSNSFDVDCWYLLERKKHGLRHGQCHPRMDKGKFLPLKRLYVLSRLPHKTLNHSKAPLFCLGFFEVTRHKSKDELLHTTFCFCSWKNIECGLCVKKRRSTVSLPLTEFGLLDVKPSNNDMMGRTRVCIERADFSSQIFFFPSKFTLKRLIWRRCAEQTNVLHVQRYNNGIVLSRTGRFTHLLLGKRQSAGKRGMFATT